MPTPGQLDPSYSRERNPYESDAEYVERMARIDQRLLFFLAFGTSDAAAAGDAGGS